LTIGITKKKNFGSLLWLIILRIHIFSLSVSVSVSVSLAPSLSVSQFGYCKWVFIELKRYFYLPYCSWIIVYWSL